MIRSVIVLCALAASASSIPLVPGETPIPILEENRKSPDAEGTYSYRYRTANGIEAKEFGYLDDDTKIPNVHGTYRYTAPNGEIVHVIYHANQHGFQPFDIHNSSKITTNFLRHLG